MTNGSNSEGGPGRHWKLAGVGGVVVAIVYSLLTGASLVSSILIGAIFAVAAGMYLGRKGAEDEASISAPPTPEPVAPEPVVSEPVAAEPAAQPAAAPVADVTGEVAAAESLVKPSTELPGQAELAERKGEWRYEASDAVEAEVAPAASVAVEEAQPLIRPSADLPGQRELEDRKGSWRYEGNTASA